MFRVNDIFGEDYEYFGIFVNYCDFSNEIFDEFVIVIFCLMS
jgi:hypothetical protein